MEVNLSKLIISKFRFNQRVKKLEYEGLYVFFLCGKYGHKQELFPELVKDFDNANLEILVLEG